MSWGAIGAAFVRSQAKAVDLGCHRAFDVSPAFPQMESAAIHYNGQEHNAILSLHGDSGHQSFKVDVAKLAALLEEQR